ncbi:MAG TPA: tetratricopeptide repeat protein [Pyrinomonadaceae bacterium]|nr:tetratricopeptide repeat protein [Pyrinomonadaceae bacterium]
MFILKTLTIALLTVAICFQCAAQDQEFAKSLEHVATLIRDNRVVEAERQLASISRSAPNSPDVLNLMGTIRAKQNRLNEAEALFLQVLRIEERFTPARMNLSYLYMVKREPDKALFQLKEILRFDPSNAEAAQKLPEMMLAAGKFDECIGFIENLRKAGAVSPDLLVMLGDAYVAKGALPEAEPAYLLALEDRLDNAAALLGLAQISRLKGEMRETSIYLARVATLSADSNSPEFLYKFALLALRVGMVDQAKAALERSLKLRPDEPPFLLALGVAWLSRGDLFEAEKLFRRLIEIEPGNSLGQLHLGYVLLNQKKYRDARLWLEKSARSPNAIPEVFYYLGLVAQEQNDDAGAIPLFEKAVQKLPNYAHARIALGASYMKLRNYTRAREELETAVKLDPNEPKAHYNLALLYARLNDSARAQEEMKIVDSLKAKGGSADGVIVVPPVSPRP